MSRAPRRLADSGDELSSLLRGALAAERSDDVDRARLDRIGRGVASAIAGGAAAAPAHAALTPKAATAAPAKATWLASKGPFVLVAAASISGIAAIALREAPTARPVDAPRLEVPMAAGEALPAAPEPPTMSPADLPSAPVTPPAAPSKPAAKTAASSPSSDTDEIALLARAHDVLHAEPARSIALCKEHERRWPSGHFAQEREALAIEALVYLGRRDDAERRWATFRERYPSSSHRVHLESLFAAPAAQ